MRIGDDRHLIPVSGVSQTDGALGVPRVDRTWANRFSAASMSCCLPSSEQTLELQRVLGDERAIRAVARMASFRDELVSGFVVVAFESAASRR